jgi:hypothetical protein
VIVKIPANPDSYRDRSAAAGARVVKGFTFSKGETFSFQRQKVRSF